MDHKGHTISVSAKRTSQGKCCDASFVIHLEGDTDPIFAGAIAGIFASIADAEAAALLRAIEWIDQNGEHSPPSKS